MCSWEASLITWNIKCNTRTIAWFHCLTPYQNTPINVTELDWIILCSNVYTATEVLPLESFALTDKYRLSRSVTNMAQRGSYFLCQNKLAPHQPNILSHCQAHVKYASADYQKMSWQLTNYGWSNMEDETLFNIDKCCICKCSYSKTHFIMLPYQINGCFPGYCRLD